MYRRRKYLYKMSRKLKTVKHMSADELKSKLYAHFDKNGSLDHLRAQLRGQLVTELFKIATPLGASKMYPENKNFDITLLPLQVSNWLVYDHLSRQGCQYTLSTFVTEANLSDPEKLLTVCDILKLFGVDTNSPEYKSFIKMYATKNEEGFSHSLLLTVIKSLFEVSHKSPVLKLSIHEGEIKEKVNRNEFEKDLLEMAFPNGLKETDEHISYEDKVSESLKFQNQNMNANQLLTSENKSAESSFYEQLQYVKEENEKEVQKLRSKLLEELDNLHSREQKIQQEMELEKKELKKERDKLLVEIQKLGEKESLLKKEYENRFQKQLREMELEFASKDHNKNREFESLQNKLAEKEQRLAEILSELTSQKEKDNLLKTEIDELKHMLKTTQGKYSSLLDENTNLLKKFEGMSDYDILKAELSAKSKEISYLQHELAEVHKNAELEKQTYIETLQILEDKIKSQNPMLQQTQRELNFTKDKLQMEELAWNNEKRKLEQEINVSRELYKDVINRIEEQRSDIQDLHRTVHILHYQIANNNKSTNLPEKVLKMQPGSTKTKSAFFKDSPQKYREYSLKFIAETKDRIDKLQQETGALQNKCSYVFSAVPANHHLLKLGISDFKTKPTSFLKSDISYNSLDSLVSMSKKYFNSTIKNEPNSSSLFHAKTKALLSDNYGSNGHYVPSKNSDFSMHPSDNTLHNQNFKELNIESVVSNSALKSHSLNFSQNSFAHQLQPENKSQDSSRFGTNFMHTLLNESKQTVLGNVPNPQEYNSSIVTGASGTQNTEVKINPNEADEGICKNSRISELKVSSEDKTTVTVKDPDQVIDNEHRHKVTAENFQLSEQTKIGSVHSITQEKVMGKIEPVVYTVSSDPKERENTNLQEKVISKTTDKEVINSVRSGLLFSEPETGTNLPMINLDEVWKRKSSVSNTSSQIKEANILVSNMEHISNISTFKNSEISLPNKQVLQETIAHTPFVLSSNGKKYSDQNEVLNNSSSIQTSVISTSDKNENSDFNISVSKENDILGLKNVVCEPGNKMVEHQQNNTKQNDSSELKNNDIIRSLQTESITRPTKEDSKVETDIKSVQEQVSAESLSELSEVHLSCGSEEQQKDDSDFW